MNTGDAKIRAAARRKQRLQRQRRTRDAVPASSVTIVTDSDNILRPGQDFRADLAAMIVTVETRENSTVEWTPLVVTSSREMMLVKGNTVKIALADYVFTRPPPSMASLARWRYTDIQRFCAGESVNPAEIFERVLSLHSKYLDYPGDGIAETLTLWTIGTYLYALFPAYPYIELNAPRNSGKSKQLNLTARLAFNGRVIVTPTEASTFRLIEDTRPTLCFDEAETFDKDQKTAFLQIVNVGYTANGTVARCEDRTYTVREFSVYCPKMFASIRGIDSTTATRCIRIQLLRTNDKVRGNRSITDGNELWAEVRHGLYSLALTHFKTIREIYQTPDVRPFANRDDEKWSPILALAMFFEQHGVSGLVESVKRFAAATVEQSTESGLPPFDEAVLRTLHFLTESHETVEMTPKRVLEVVQDQTSWDWQNKKPQSVGYALNRLGFKKCGHTRDGSLYSITRKQVMDVALRYDVSLADTPEKAVTAVTTSAQPFTTESYQETLHDNDAA